VEHSINPSYNSCFHTNTLTLFTNYGLNYIEINSILSTLRVREVDAGASLAKSQDEDSWAH
jgi:hypothetical protein